MRFVIIWKEKRQWVWWEGISTCAFFISFSFLLLSVYIYSYIYIWSSYSLFDFFSSRWRLLRSSVEYRQVVYLSRALARKGFLIGMMLILFYRFFIFWMYLRNEWHRFHYYSYYYDHTNDILCALVTGGGPGAMEAANLGAYLANQ
jgi:hypothetical protein